MVFKDLSKEQQEKMHIDFMSSAMSVGGRNPFLQIIEDVKAESITPLLNKHKAFNLTNGKVIWNKSIYKDTYTLILDSMRKEEKDGDILIDLKPKDYRRIMNMMRAIRPIELVFRPKNSKNGKGFIIPILDTSEDRKTKFSTIFKSISPIN